MAERNFWSRKVIAIIDYGVGNVHSVYSALRRLGHESEIISDPKLLARFSSLILPGVGSFDSASRSLSQTGFRNAIVDLVREKNTKLLGICLGMQLLFDSSDEGDLGGLSILGGTCKRIPTEVNGQKNTVPHVGWNTYVCPPKNMNAKAVMPFQKAKFYFSHSYYSVPSDQSDVLGLSTHGIEFPSVVGSGGIWGAQFHPEKSGNAGLHFLNAFASYSNSEKTGE
jgi:glutamine amidotransferase